MKLIEITRLVCRFCMGISPVKMKELSFTMDSEKCEGGGGSVLKEQRL